jgi:hypothetical protein
MDSPHHRKSTGKILETYSSSTIESQHTVPLVLTLILELEETKSMLREVNWMPLEITFTTNPQLWQVQFAASTDYIHEKLLKFILLLYLFTCSLSFS